MIHIEKSLLFESVKIIRPECFTDIRGEFYTTYNQNEYKFDVNGELLIFKEDNISKSTHNVLRGLHGDTKTWKLIQCLFGEVLFVLVDFNKDSITYLEYETYLLNDKSKMQILIPPNFVNGYYCKSSNCIFSYKQSELYSGSQNQLTVNWRDPKININWTFNSPIMSDRDKNAPFIV